MLSEPECALSLDEASPKTGGIPPELSFEEIVKNNTLPPCSLNDFMDYLVYEEHDAEPLQFFLWYCDYIERWSQLLPRQKALSPAWDPRKDTESRRSLSLHRHKRSQSEKLARILTILEKSMGGESAQTAPGRGSRSSDGMANFSLPMSPERDSTSAAGFRNDLQPFTIQPFRQEVTMVVRHYIIESAPRQLRLSHEDRSACLDAVQVTTHPSALLPAFTAAEVALRSQLHPKFVKWSGSNANRHRVVFIEVLGAVIILLGFCLNVFLTLSSLSRFYRILCILLWWPGLTVVVAAFQGVCVLLHCRNLRTLQPWEQLSGAYKPSQMEDIEKGLAGARKHSRKDTDASTFSGADPLRKGSMRPFGPANDFRDEPWVELYAKQSRCSKVFAPSVKTQNQHVAMMQDQVVFYAVCWGGLVSSVLAAGSLFIPSARLFL
ncbi:Regulator of G protein-like protein [Pleurostoma richardsiae]|uniref:Regulator of G protein-like protein n=1 Tax=Pleurostoma richardsiae TaxID=41990 RepID=A0AA38R7Y9_9PEZI|nr:Regulator of G protein-like protein [Pleurostoma richardsiae]